MSIAKMKKISVIGLDQKKEKVIAEIMKLGNIQITKEKAKSEEAENDTGLKKAGLEHIGTLDSKINDVSMALETLERYSTAKKPLFFTRRKISARDFERMKKSHDAVMGNVRGILQLRNDMHKLHETRNKLTTDLNAVIPWAVYDVPLNITETKETYIEVGVLPSTVNPDTLRHDIEKISKAVEIKEIARDKDFIYIVSAFLKRDEEEILKILKRTGYTQTRFAGFEGTAKENRKELESRIAGIDRDIQKVARSIEGRYGEIREIECLYDSLVIERDKEQAKIDLAETRKTFNFEGWIPESCQESVNRVLDRNECYYAYRDPKDDEDVPVIIQNPGITYPFEGVTEMYSLPAYKGFDPTSYFAFFYALFFGLMLSDAGYGVVLTIATYVILKKFDLEGMTYKMIKMFFYCGIFTIFWGALFGGWFGDAVHVGAKTILGIDANVNPIWFDPIKDPTRLLIFSLEIGVIHIFLGMAINAYMLIKRRQIFDVFCDVLSWYLVIGGAAIWILFMSSETVAKIGKIMAISGAAIVLLTGGRKNKGIMKVFGGITALYGVTGYISDILSYARLLALGLATGVIAQVVNTIGSLSGGGIIGTLIFVIVFFVGHIFNMAINSLGAFVHTSRLQYIEFFGQFYEDGGNEFEPFMKNTKYIRIIEDETEVN